MSPDFKPHILASKTLVTRVVKISQKGVPLMNYKRTLLTAMFIIGVTKAYAMDPNDAKRIDTILIEKPINYEALNSSEEGLARRKTDVDQRIKEITARIEALTNYDPRISRADYKLLDEAINNLDTLPDLLELPGPAIWFIGAHGKSFFITPRPKIPQTRSSESFDR